MKWPWVLRETMECEIAYIKNDLAQVTEMYERTKDNLRTTEDRYHDLVKHLTKPYTETQPIKVVSPPPTPEERMRTAERRLFAPEMEDRIRVDLENAGRSKEEALQAAREIFAAMNAEAEMSDVPSLTQE